MQFLKKFREVRALPPSLIRLIHIQALPHTPSNAQIKHSKNDSETQTPHDNLAPLLASNDQQWNEIVQNCTAKPNAVVWSSTCNVKGSHKSADVNDGVFSGVFTCRLVACEDAGQAVYSQLHLHVTGEYNRQQVGISSQTTEYVAHHPVYRQRVHSYSCSQKLEISSVQRVKCSVYMLCLAIYTSIASKNAGVQRVKTLVKTPLMVVSLAHDIKRPLSHVFC